MAKKEVKDLGQLEANGDDLRLQWRLLTFMLSKKVDPIPSEEERKPYLESKCNIFSRILFWWLFPVMNVGYKRTLHPEDLYKLTDDIKVETMYKRFSGIFDKQLKKAQKKHIEQKCSTRGETLDTSTVDEDDDLKDFKLPKTTMVLSLFLTFWKEYTLACVFLALANAALTLNPLQTKKLITFVERRALGVESAVGKGIGYSFGSAGVVLATGIFINHYFYRAMLVGAKAKAVLTKALLHKSFHLSARSKHEYPTSKITSMMGTDLSRIDFALAFQPYLIVFPIPFAIAIAILIVNVGPVALVGVALVLSFMLIIMSITKTLFTYRFKANKFTDARVDYIKEVLNNLKMIKFYSWEIPYFENIKNVRIKETKIIFKMQALRNLLLSLAMTLTLIASMVTFLILYGIRSSDRTAASIFSSLALFNVLTGQVIMLPMALASGADAFVGSLRIGQFLAAEEVEENQVSIMASNDAKVSMEEHDVAIEVKDADYCWEVFSDEDAKDDGADLKQTETSREYVELEKFLEGKSTSESLSKENESLEATSFPGLQNIDLVIKKGEFVVITGLIGSGKSSLLSAMSGFMKRTRGSISVNGSLILCGYPWIQNATLRENILFGSEYDEKKYEKVVFSCALESDIDILPAGDNTEIGERGITLSGGQKARINLARAVYAGKDIILLDDVLSAVDAKVGKHIMKHCILGLLSEKTRVLATHQLSLIGSADRIIFLNGDGTISVGTYNELLQSNEPFSKLMNFSVQDDESEEEEGGEDEEVVDSTLQRENSNSDESERFDFNKGKTEDGRITLKEERAVNSISFQVYKIYFTLGSGIFHPYLFLPVVFLAIVLAAFAQVFTNTWLSFWTENRFHGRSDGFYIGLYVMFVILAFVFLSFEFVALVYQSNYVSRMLNIMAIKKVLHAPMSLIDITPMGRILNRFTKDTDVLDNEIGDQFRMLCFFLSQIIAVLILCICYLPWFAIAVPFLVAMFVAIANYYQASAREIKRLEAVQRSFVYNNFNEVLSGMQTIQAYHDDSRFLKKNDDCVDRMNEAYYLTIANQRWLAIHLDIIATILALIIALLCVNRVFSIGASSVGLLLSYVLQIAGQLSMLLRTMTQVENEMNSVERISSYAYDLPQEAAYHIEETQPPAEWPTGGAIEMKNVSMRYRKELPLVLKNISLSLKPGQKVGICGRTGAGKSSIMTALYRISELDGGSIFIDGLDISKIGLHDLRSKLSIIPQDPVLFRGTIRSNLDPFKEHLDDVLWSSLRRAGVVDGEVIEQVKAQTAGSTNLHKFHLDQSVEDNGSNFSLGERQLIAFSRALVRNSTILILDEATSSVDYETDHKVQNTIIREFKNCTILCIAHRLRTIIHYDRILVLDKGEVQEFDTPWNLFQEKNSIFRQMCDKSGITSNDFHKS